MGIFSSDVYNIGIINIYNFLSTTSAITIKVLHTSKENTIIKKMFELNMHADILNSIITYSMMRY